MWNSHLSNYMQCRDRELLYEYIRSKYWLLQMRSLVSVLLGFLSLFVIQMIVTSNVIILLGYFIAKHIWIHTHWFMLSSTHYCQMSAYMLLTITYRYTCIAKSHDLNVDLSIEMNTLMWKHSLTPYYWYNEFNTRDFLPWFSFIVA